ncbi:MAG: hypothetical protein ABUK01_11915 [Leptospirales bacterium]
MDKQERELLAHYEQLNKEGKNQLIDYALFLKNKYGSDPVPQTPLNIPRPEQESVIDAMKRLSKNYPMISKKKVMGPASELLTMHMMQGRAADEVIDELEQLFKSHFEQEFQ